MTDEMGILKVKEGVKLLLLAMPVLRSFLFDYSEPYKINLEKFMLNNFQFNVPVEKFAQLTGRSLAGFKRDFQKRFHTSPGKWLLEKRLQQSMALLKNRGKSVAETAFESGFENSSHFSRSFKQRFGMSPMEARQTLVS